VLIRSIDRLPGTAELVELAAAGEDDEHDLGVTEHGEFVVLLDQAVAARPAGCSPRGLEMRRRRAGGDAGDLAPAPATRAAAMGMDCGTGGRARAARVVAALAGLAGFIYCSRASASCSMLGHKNIAVGPH